MTRYLFYRDNSVKLRDFTPPHFFKMFYIKYLQEWYHNCNTEKIRSCSKNCFAGFSIVIKKAAAQRLHGFYGSCYFLQL